MADKPARPGRPVCRPQLFRRALQGALSCGQPLLEDVDAVVMWPDQPRQSYRYRRLVLPFKRRDGSSVLLGTTLHDPDIDLRIKRNQELLQVLQ